MAHLKKHYNIFIIMKIISYVLLLTDYFIL